MISQQLEAFGKPLAQVLRETPEPHGTEVIIKIGSSGVCHSDVHLHDGYFDLGGGNKIDVARVVNPPRTLGHEIAGTVVAVGPSAQGAQVGDRRVVYPWIGCGQCAVCSAGNEHLCGAPRVLGIQRDGGFADHVVVPDAKYLLDYGSLREEQACTYACSGLTAFGALKKAAPLDCGDTLLIIGAGGVGLAGIRLGRELYPNTRITVAELDSSKWTLARDAGADEVLDPSADGTAKTLMKSTQGGFTAAIDFVGAGSSFAFGFSTLRRGGRLICVGLFGGSTSIAPAMVAMRAVQVFGSYVGSLAEMHELMAIARSGRLPDLPVTVLPLDAANRTLDDLRAGRVQGRTVLQP